jgi:2-methylisocitrate lyase-like PEP mutase family enzyme
MTAKKRLRALIKQPKLLVLPGVHDALSARLAQAHGFEAIFAGGNAATGTLLGQSDLGQLGVLDFVGHYGRIADAVDVPVLVDADTGFGGVHSVRRMVRDFERAGVAGFFMEDQTTPKRCGYLAGKAVVPLQEMQGKLAAALDARQDPDLIICARTDAFAIEGRNMAVERALAYLEAGADMTFVQGADTEEDLQFVCSKIPCPQLANISQAASTKAMSLEAIQKTGAAAVIFAIAAMLAAAGAVDRLLGSLKRNGDLTLVTEDMMSIQRYNEIVALQKDQAREQRYTNGLK